MNVMRTQLSIFTWVMMRPRRHTLSRWKNGLVVFLVAAMGVLSLVPAQARENLVATITMNAWDFGDPAQVVQKMKAADFNHVTLYVPWSEIEPREGEFQFEKFDGFMAPLAAQGVRFILVLDFGGRPYFDDQGRLTHRSVIPAWFLSRHADAMMRNFSGESTKQINFVNPEARRLTSRFVDRSVKYFGKKYEKSITGFAVGLQEELEIKYGQEGYQWRDYGPEFTEKFSKKHGAAMPVINYNNDVIQSHPKKEPMLEAFMEMRDDDLREAVCHYSAIIRGHGRQMVAYFGEIFTTHDAIYGGGVVETLGSCVDIGVVDFNFFDGYELKPDSDVLPLMANYLAHNGFKKIMIGVYGERWTDHAKKGILHQAVKQSIEKGMVHDRVIGYEFGGFYENASKDRTLAVDFDGLATLNLATRTKQKNEGRARVGLLASRMNFYFWHGERSNDRNVHQDALIKAYALLSQMPSVEVVVLGERALAQDAEKVEALDAIVIPHQLVLTNSTKERLRSFWSSGGVLIQDMRLGEFTFDGSPTNDWMHDVFGIRDIQWSTTPQKFNYQGQQIGLDMHGKTYVNHALLRARDGYAIEAQALIHEKSGWLSRLKKAFLGGGQRPLVDPNYGLVLRGERSLVFGCLPQLVDDTSAQDWQRIFFEEVRAALARGKKARQVMREMPVTGANRNLIGNSPGGPMLQSKDVRAVR